MGCSASKSTNTVSSAPTEEYKISVSTSSAYKHAGSDATVHIQLVGEDDTATEWKELNKLFRNDFEPGSKEVFKFKAINVGKPLYIRIELRKAGSDDAWACEEVIVTFRRKDIIFPVYDWIEKEATITRGNAVPYARTDKAMQDVRRRETDHSKSNFAWVDRPSETEIGWGIPRYVNTEKYSELPKIFKRTKVQQESFDESKIEAAANAALATIGNFISGIEDLDDFKKLYKFLFNSDDPPFINRWDTDVEFGRQQLLGVTPLALKRCTSLPDNCQIPDSLSVNDCTLQEEMKKGKIFIGDYSTVFKGLTKNKNSSEDPLYCPDAVGLFHANSDNDFVPLAIQLVPGDDETVFTPESERYDWLLAKMYYRTAAANLHQWYYHFLLTHNVMEVFSVALFRCFPRCHPLYKLLRPHLQTVPAINTEARSGLIGEGTSANKSLAILGIDAARATFKTFKMKDLNLPEVLKERGLDDKQALPKYYFRDDALRLWNIIKNFVSDIIEIYYKNNEDVKNDLEIQEFVRDFATEGLGWQDGDTKGMPEKMETVDELILLCTTIIYTSSAGHASVNFPQYQIYQFVPNAPVGMRLPPHRKGEANMERIMKSLPDLMMSALQVAIPYTLSEISPDEVYLGEYPMRLFTDLDAIAAIERYKANLSQFSIEVRKRNQTAGDDAYDWLLPEKVPNSIAI